MSGRKAFVGWTSMAVLILLFIISGVQSISDLLRPLQRSDVIGTYVGRYEQVDYKTKYDQVSQNRDYQRGNHRLELRDDGTYAYEFTSLDGKETCSKSGVWEFTQWDDQAHVTLRKFIRGPFHNEKYNDDDAYHHAKWERGRLILVVQADLGYHYRKLPPEKP